MGNCPESLELLQQVEVGKDYYCADKSSNTPSDLFLQATHHRIKLVFLKCAAMALVSIKVKNGYNGEVIGDLCCGGKDVLVLATPPAPAPWSQHEP